LKVKNIAFQENHDYVKKMWAASTKVHPNEYLMLKFIKPEVEYLLPDHRRD